MSPSVQIRRHARNRGKCPICSRPTERNIARSARAAAPMSTCRAGCAAPTPSPREARGRRARRGPSHAKTALKRPIDRAGVGAAHPSFAPFQHLGRAARPCPVADPTSPRFSHVVYSSPVDTHIFPCNSMRPKRWSDERTWRGGASGEASSSTGWTALSRHSRTRSTPRAGSPCPPPSAPCWSATATAHRRHLLLPLARRSGARCRRPEPCAEDRRASRRPAGLFGRARRAVCRALW